MIAETLPAKRLFTPLIAMFFIVYAGYHLFHGQRGVFALISKQHELEQAQEKLDQLKSQQAVMENKVKRLNSHSLDADLLDEQARRVLGYAGKEEVIYLQDGASGSR
jgi:cell division protein FtsB